MKFRLSTLLFSLIALLALPSATFAAKRVSQDFPNAQMVYLPLQNDDADVLSGKTFYTTEFAGLAKPWSVTSTTLPLEANRIYNVDSDLAIGTRFNGYTYFVLLTGTATDNPNINVFDQIEIWRVSQTTGKVERTATWPAYSVDSNGATTYFSATQLVKYNHALYLLHSNGILERSIDGVRWNEVDTSSLNIDETTNPVYHLISTKQGLYLGTGGYNLKPMVYFSTDAMNWSKLAGDYDKKKGDVEALTLFQDNLYASVSNVNGTEYQLWKYTTSTDTWASVLTTAQQINLLDHNATALYYTTVQYGSSDTTKVEPVTTTIEKSTDGLNFTSVYSSNSTTQNIVGDGFIKGLSKPVFIIRDLANSEASYLLRVQ